MVLDLALVELLKLLGLRLGQLLALMVKNRESLDQTIRAHEIGTKSADAIQERETNLFIKFGVLVRLMQEHLRWWDGLLCLLFELNEQ